MNIMFIVFFSVVALADYQLGDIVVECSFDNSRGHFTGCLGFEIPMVASFETDYLTMDSTDTSARDGPSGDHTSGRGMCMNWNEGKK